MADMEKLTKTQKFDLILEALETSIIEDEQREIIVNFVKAEQELLEKRIQKEKERAQKKKAEGDELRKTIFGLLTDEPQTVNDILIALDNEALTSQKVIARLSALVNAGEVTKEQIKVDNKRVMSYRLAGAKIEE